METLERALEFKAEYLNSQKWSAENMHNDLLGYPTPERVVPYIVKALELKDESFRFFGSFDGHVWNAVSHIVRNVYSNNQAGTINISMLFDSVKSIAELYERFGFLSRIGTTNKSRYAETLKFVECESKEETLIAVGRLDEDYIDADPDPYETAGGYRGWRALKGTLVKYYLNNDLTIRLEFESNCEVDHYNNNFFGNSTGGGTTKYKVGERVEVRSVTLGREAFDKGWNKAEIKATVKKLDYNKIMKLAAEFQPEMSRLF